jgi:hypothetical protein
LESTSSQSLRPSEVFTRYSRVPAISPLTRPAKERAMRSGWSSRIAMMLASGVPQICSRGIRIIDSAARLESTITP